MFVFFHVQLSLCTEYSIWGKYFLNGIYQIPLIMYVLLEVAFITCFEIEETVISKSLLHLNYFF